MLYVQFWMLWGSGSQLSATSNPRTFTANPVCLVAKYLKISLFFFVFMAGFLLEVWWHSLRMHWDPVLDTVFFLQFYYDFVLILIYLKALDNLKKHTFYSPFKNSFFDRNIWSEVWMRANQKFYFKEKFCLHSSPVVLCLCPFYKPDHSCCFFWSFQVVFVMAEVMERELNCSSLCESPPLCFIQSGVSGQDSVDVLQTLCSLNFVSFVSSARILASVLSQQTHWYAIRTYVIWGVCEELFYIHKWTCILRFHIVLKAGVSDKRLFITNLVKDSNLEHLEIKSPGTSCHVPSSSADYVSGGFRGLYCAETEPCKETLLL